MGEITSQLENISEILFNNGYCAMDTDDFGDQRDVYHDADWFCADGERRTEDAT